MFLEKEYLIGVAHLDAQHHSLFSVINRIHDILMENDYNRHKRMCKEALKFFENHILRHFSDEEAYMRSIQFPRYEDHKSQHDAIKEAFMTLKADIIASDYAPQSIKYLLGTVTAWLSYHTIEIDSTIGKDAPRITLTNNAAVAMENAITQVISDVFRSQLNLVDGNYQGLPQDGEIFCLVDCSHPDGRRFRIMAAISAQMVLQSINALFSSKQSQIDEVAISAIEELCAMLTIHFIRNYQNGEFFHLDHLKIFDKSTFLALQPAYAPLCSLLFDCTYGSFLVRAWAD